MATIAARDRCVMLATDPRLLLRFNDAGAVVAILRFDEEPVTPLFAAIACSQALAACEATLTPLYLSVCIGGVGLRHWRIRRTSEAKRFRLDRCNIPEALRAEEREPLEVAR